MNKLIKMATIVAGVGAMLSFAGCGEGAAKLTPQDELSAMFSSVDAGCVKLGADPLVGAEMIAKAKTMTQEQATAELAKIKPTVALFTKYVDALTEVNEIVKKATGTPYLKDSHNAYSTLEEFFKVDDIKRKEALNALIMLKAKSQTFLKLVAELNELLKK